MSYRHKLEIFFLKSFNVHKYAYKYWTDNNLIGNVCKYYIRFVQYMLYSRTAINKIHHWQQAVSNLLISQYNIDTPPRRA